MEISIKRTSLGVVALGLAVSFAMPVNATTPDPMTPLAAGIAGLVCVVAAKNLKDFFVGVKEEVEKPVDDFVAGVKKSSPYLLLAGGATAWYSQNFRSLLASGSSKAVSAVGAGATKAVTFIDDWAKAPHVRGNDGVLANINTRTASGFFVGVAAALAYYGVK